MGEFLSWSVMKPFRSTSKSVKSAATLPAAVESCQWTNLYRETMGNPAKLQYFLNSILPMWGSVTANHSANLPSSGHLSNMATNVTWWHSRLRLWYPWRGFDHWTHLFELFPPVNVTICINHLRNLRNQNRPFHLVKRHGNKMKIWPEMSDLEIGSRDHWRSGSHPPCLRGVQWLPPRRFDFSALPLQHLAEVLSVSHIAVWNLGQTKWLWKLPLKMRENDDEPMDVGYIFRHTPFLQIAV